MQAQKIQFKIFDKDKNEQQVDLVYSLLGSWLQNGQILGEQSPIAENKESFSVFVNTPEVDSLDVKYDNKYTQENYEKLKKVGLSLPVIEDLGVHPESIGLCDCENCSSYILYTTFILIESPLRCGDCSGVIPLYKIPKTSEYGYYDIMAWQSNYQSCDSLQMGCRVGERFGTNQMMEYDSPLSRDGLAICQKIQELTQMPTYYYLYKGSARSEKEELNRKCPSCGGKWLRKKPLCDLFDFQCKKCKLLSNIAWELK